MSNEQAPADSTAPMLPPESKSSDDATLAPEPSPKKQHSVQIQEPIVKPGHASGGGGEHSGGGASGGILSQHGLSDSYGGGGYTVIKVEEKHGILHNAIPCMPLPLAVIGCIFNILVPGLGTLLSSFTVFCCGTTRLESPMKAFGLNILSAVLQMLTFLIIVGWIWSILWGMTFIQLALSCHDHPMSTPVPYYVRRQSSVE